MPRYIIGFLFVILMGFNTLKSQFIKLSPMPLDSAQRIYIDPKLPLISRWTTIDRSFFEKISGGNDQPITALQWASETRFLDSLNLVPLLWSDYKDSLFSVSCVWVVAQTDTLWKDRNWIDLILGDPRWEHIQWEVNSGKSEMNDSFRMRDFLLPLACNHRSVYLYFEELKEVSLNIDDQWIRGLGLEDCIPFIEKHIEHLKEFHQSGCIKSGPLVSIEFSKQNIPMTEIRSFIRTLSNKGILVEAHFPMKH